MRHIGFYKIVGWKNRCRQKGKKTDNEETSKAEKDNHASSGSGLLKKKRLGSSKTVKPNKSVQH